MRLFLMAMMFLGVALAAEPVSLETQTGTLYGTLELPESETPMPIVLIHPGSGPTDRDGNSPQLPGKNDSLKLLAQNLAENGVASVRIDKRGIGESASALTSEADLSFDTYIEDAAAWLELLQNDERFGSVIMLGHSEGSLIGMVAAERVGADAYISVAGAGENAADTIKRQLSEQLPENLLAETDSVLDSLSTGETVTPLPENIGAIPGISSLFRPSVQPYLISWFQYEPAEEITELDMPVLIVQGSTDIQTTVEDAETLSAAKPDAELVVIDGMNHVFKDAPADPEANLATYSDPSLPLTDGLLETLLSFVEGVE